MKHNARINFTLTPDLKIRLQALALRQHRSVSETIRKILEEGVTFAEDQDPPEGHYYEIALTYVQALRFKKLGYTLLLIPTLT